MDFVDWLRRVVLVAMLAIAAAAAFILLAPQFLRAVEREAGWREALTRPPVESLSQYIADCASCEHVGEARAALDGIQRGSGLMARLAMLDTSGRRREQITAAFLAGEAHVVSTGTRDATVWDAGTGARLRDLAVRDASSSTADRDTYGYSAKALTVAPDGQQIAILTDTGAIWLWNVNTGVPSARLPLGIPDGERLIFAPDSRRLLWLATGSIGVADLEQRAATPLSHPDVMAAGFAGDGTLITVSRDAITRWSAGARTPRDSVTIETYATPLAISADASLIFFASQDKLEIWDAGGDAPLQVLGPHGDDVRGACESDGRIIVGAQDGNLHVWDRNSWQEIARQRAHPSRLEELACGRGRVLTVGQGGREGKLWSIERLVAAGRFEGPPRVTGDIGMQPPTGMFDRMVIAAADANLLDRMPRVLALLDLYDEELTLAAFIGVGVVLLGFVLRSWLR